MATRKIDYQLILLGVAILMVLAWGTLIAVEDMIAHSVEEAWEAVK